MKTILVRVSSKPDNPEYGYGDHFEVLNDRCDIIHGGHCSTCPNPFSPTSHKPYKEVYGWIKPGEYKARCIDHYKYENCFIINDGGEVPCRYPNVNHESKEILTEVMIHTGGFKSSNPNWRASAGCLTIHPEEWDSFLEHFKIGEKVKLIIREYIENKIDPEKKLPVKKRMRLRFAQWLKKIIGREKVFYNVLYTI